MGERHQGQLFGLVKGTGMNTYEDDEFERIEREIKWRQMLIDNPPVSIPLITEEEWQALYELPEA